MRGTELGDGLDSKFDFGLIGIGELLSRDRLRVPIYQRSYSWGDSSEDGGDQVEEFWTDIKSSFDDSDSEYFLGTVVLAREGAAYSVVDGQQRLATTIILLAAIREEFRRLGDERRVRITQEKYIAKDDMDSTEIRPQLQLNSEGDEFFRMHIVEGGLATAGRRSHALLASAYATLRAKVRAFADESPNRAVAALRGLVGFIKDRLRIIVVSVPTEADAFLIFEALNDRGVDLTIADLLKNYLFGRSGTRLEIVRDSWVSASTNLDVSVDGGQLFTGFLRHFWSSIYGATRERELYSEIKKRITTSNNSVDFASKLNVSSRLYSALLSGDHEFWTSIPNMRRGCIEALDTLKLEQNKPLLLAAMQHFEKDELARLMEKMVHWGASEF